MSAVQNNPAWYDTSAARERLHLAPLAFSALPGFDEDDHLAAWVAFSRTFAALAGVSQPLRAAALPSPALIALGGALRNCAPPPNARQAKALFEHYFQPFAIVLPDAEDCRDVGFLTGYYEPLVEGSMVETAEFTAPILARPDDLVSFAPDEHPFSTRPELSAARRRADGALEPYPDRAAIEAGVIAQPTRPLVWLRDAVEVFMIQVQGSAKVKLSDGRWLRLVYAGRNGQPYTSIGRILVEKGHIRAADMSLATLKGWIRAQGQNFGEPGRALMQQNRSYVFFAAQSCADLDEGPSGGAGVPLSPLRSIAVDRTIWSYGLPFWVEAEIPWAGDTPSPFRRLMIAQDTGSAILGPARADLYFGSGDGAGRLAAGIRHPARVAVLLPKASGGTA